MNFSEKHTSLIVQGSQATEFLQGQITIDTEKISNEDFKPACICNNKGRVMATFWIKKIENGFKIAILEELIASFEEHMNKYICLLYTSPSPRDATLSRMPSSA